MGLSCPYKAKLTKLAKLTFIKDLTCTLVNMHHENSLWYEVLFMLIKYNKYYVLLLFNLIKISSREGNRYLTSGPYFLHTTFFFQLRVYSWTFNLETDCLNSSLKSRLPDIFLRFYACHSVFVQLTVPEIVMWVLHEKNDPKGLRKNKQISTYCVFS